MALYSIASLTAPEGSASITFERESRSLYSTLQESGYAVIDCSRGADSGGIHPLTASVFGPAKRFFAQPLPKKIETKRAETTGDSVERGYYAAKDSNPEHLTVHLGDVEQSPDFVTKAALALAQMLQDSREVPHVGNYLIFEFNRA